MKPHELKDKIVNIIMGQGMGGSTQYLHFISDYFEKIGEQRIREDVLKIITEIAEDFEDPASSRAVYVLGELSIPNKELIFLEVTRRLDPILDKIIGAMEIPESSMKYLVYFCELNKLIGKFNISEAKSFLEKQARYLQRPMPQPNSNEHYVYHFLGKSAAEALKSMR